MCNAPLDDAKFAEVPFEKTGYEKGS